MVTKGQKKSLKTDPRLKKWTKYVCGVCGKLLTVDQEYLYDSCDITCCGRSMTFFASCEFTAPDTKSSFDHSSMSL
jgi:hypothetical protein